MPLFILSLGFIMFSFSKNAKVNHQGSLFMGMGFMLYGNTLLGASVRLLRDYDPFVKLLLQVQHPLLVRSLCGTFFRLFATDRSTQGIAIGAMSTLIVQASSATISIAGNLAAQGLISFHTAVSLVLGASIQNRARFVSSLSPPPPPFPLRSCKFP
jgi:phosphate:Na+ symporter